MITAPVLLVIDEDAEQLGEMSLKDAQQAADDRGLDLIEVAPKADPPVAKIMSLSKFRYEQKKKKKENKKKTAELKEMWFKAFIGDGDLQHKLKKVQEFIKKKNPVKITIRAKGRVKREHMTSLMSKILKDIEEFAEPEARPKFQGRNFAVVVKPRKTKLVKEEAVKPKAKKVETTDKKSEVVEPEVKKEEKVEEKKDTKSKTTKPKAKKAKPASSK